MLSRVADAIYWMSRYIERAENLARFMDVTFNLMLDLPQSHQNAWAPLVYTTGDHEYFREKYGDANQSSVIEFLAFDQDYPGSIRSCVKFARENARSVRETISSEMWEQLNLFYYMVREASANDRIKASPLDFFQEIKQASHLFKGITDATMSRGEGWNFSRLGRLLERADKTSRILDVKYYLLLPTVHDVGSPTDDLQWQAVLRSVSAMEMYSKQFHAITPSKVAQFLILDRHFPRAINYSVTGVEHALHAISGTPMDTFRNSAEQRVGQLRSELAYTTVDDVIQQGLHEFLDLLQTKLNKIGSAVHETFIAVKPVDTSVQSQENGYQRQSIFTR